jgi:two-component system response regulator PilR (NtrC family)
MSRRSRGQPKVLLVDDEPDLLELLELTLSRMGLDTTRAESVAEAMRLLDGDCLRPLPHRHAAADGPGLKVVEHINQKGLDLPVAVITAYGSAENAVAALKAGAFDYLAKPVALEQLRALVKQALKVPEKAPPPSGYSLLGESPAMLHVRDMIERLAKSQAPGVHQRRIGKRQGAGGAHDPRRRHACRAAVHRGQLRRDPREPDGERVLRLPQGRVHGAEADRDGFFQAANGGTLFLDEVADLPLAMQVKLIARNQEKKVRKVGSTQEDAVDVRIISATPQEAFRARRRRRVPAGPLLPVARDRARDAEPARHARGHSAHRQRDPRAPFAQRPGAARRRVDRGARALSVPGNVRELENVLERGLSLAADTQRINVDDLAPDTRSRKNRSSSSLPATSGRCRTISIVSSGRRSTKRWRRRATTARQPRSCSASLSAP